MTLSPSELAELEKKLAEAEQARANADKTRAETEKQRAELEAARIDKLIEQATGAVPDLNSLKPSTVTFSEGKALRQGEAISGALEKLARAIAKDVAAKVQTTDPAATRIFVTSEAKVVSLLALYRQLKSEAEFFTRELTSARVKAEAVMVRRTDFDAGAGLVCAAVAGKAVTELASLFELTVAATTSATDVPAASVQAAVIGELLAASPELQIRHQWTQPPATDSPLLAALERLTILDVQAAEVDARLDGMIKSLGEAAGQKEELGKLHDARNALLAVTTKARAFAERVTEVPEPTGDSLLAVALSVEHLCEPDNASAVLVVGGARAETNQLLITRRIFSPRLQVSTTVEVDYALLADARILASGHVGDSVSYFAKITPRGAQWTEVKPLRGNPIGPTPGGGDDRNPGFWNESAEPDSGLGTPPRSGLAALFGQQPDVDDLDRAVDPLDHVDDGQGGNGSGGHRFHLDPGAVGGPDGRGDGDPVIGQREVDLGAVDTDDVGERQQVWRPLGRGDAGDPGNGEHVPFGNPT